MSTKCLNKKYVNEWDKIVTDFIYRDEPYSGYWERSENFALKLVDKLLKRKYSGRLLDIGCGQGRLLNRFASNFQEIVAVDAVDSRINIAKSAADATGLSNIIFVNQLFEDCYSTLGKFDVVLCSHVIQHLPTNNLEDIFRYINNVLVVGGIFVLITAHSRSKVDAFMLSKRDSKENNIIQIKFNSDNEFNEFIGRGCSIDMIPTHSFSIDALRKYMLGYRLRNIHCFHSLHNRNILDFVLFRDKIINIPGFRRFFGIDVIVIGEKYR